MTGQHLDQNEWRIFGDLPAPRRRASELSVVGEGETRFTLVDYGRGLVASPHCEIPTAQTSRCRGRYPDIICFSASGACVVDPHREP